MDGSVEDTSFEEHSGNVEIEYMARNGIKCGSVGKLTSTFTSGIEAQVRIFGRILYKIISVIHYLKFFLTIKH